MISVIIPTYNRGHIITRAIDSALRQTYRDFEIIVIDDGSTDNTRTVLEPYQDQIKYFYQENRGVTEARNKGIKESYGEFIAFLDSDDYWLPEKLEMQMNYFKNHPEVAMVYTRHWKEIDTGKNKIMPKKNKLVEGYIYKYLLFSSYIWMGAVMVRKDSLFNVGLLDHPLDKHMFLKIARKYNVGAIDKPLAVHYKVNTVY